MPCKQRFCLLFCYMVFPSLNFRSVEGSIDSIIIVIIMKELRLSGMYQFMQRV